MDEVGNAPMPDEEGRRVPARPADRRNQDEPRPRSRPAGGIEEVPQGGAVGPGPAVAAPADEADD